MGNGMLMPVAAGLAIGIAFVVAFSVFAGSVFGGSASEKIGRIIITVDNLKNAYQVGEPVSFTVRADGVSNNLCNHPKPHVRIANADDGETVWASPATFSTAIGCINPQGFDLEWRFGYPGEELPYPSGIVGYQPYDNNIMMEKAGSYIMTVEFEDFVVEREFSVTGSTSNEIISLSKGGCFGICHAHAIRIYENGTAIHREYEEGNRIYYIFQIPQNTTAELVRQFYEVDFSSIPKPRLLPDAQHTRISFTDADGKTQGISYVTAPQELRDLDLQIEQLTEKYDDRVIDYTEHSITDYQVHEPAEQNLSNEDDETGEFETENGIGEQIPVDVVDDDSATIKIEYYEDS